MTDDPGLMLHIFTNKQEFTIRIFSGLGWSGIWRIFRGSICSKLDRFLHCNDSCIELSCPFELHFEWWKFKLHRNLFSVIYSLLFGLLICWHVRVMDYFWCPIMSWHPWSVLYLLFQSPLSPISPQSSPLLFRHSDDQNRSEDPLMSPWPCPLTLHRRPEDSVSDDRHVLAASESERDIHWYWHSFS